MNLPTHNERNYTMKKRNTTKKQSGFFDLGLSLLILAVAGGSVYFAEQEQAEKYAQQQENSTPAVNRQSATTLAEMTEPGVYLAPAE